MSLIKRIKASEYLRNIATLTSGTTFAQIISIGTAPILYRIYEKVDYGTLGVYMAIAGVVSTFSTLQYTQAILLEKEDIDAKQVMWLTRIINIVIASMSFVLVFIGKDFIADKLNAPDVAPWLFLIPISIFFGGQNEIFRVWANRKKKYKILTFNTILMAILIPTISITLGLIYAGPLGLFVGLLASHVIPPLVMTYALTRGETLGLSVINFDGVKVQARKHINFPKFSLPSEFINRFSNQLPVFMLSAFSGPITVGVYNLSTRILGLPIQLISRSVGEVFKQRAIDDYNKHGNCKVIFVKTAKSLFLISLIPLFILFLFAPDLFAFVFGEQWREAGVFSQILAVFFAFKFFVSPLTFLYFMKNKLKEDMFLHIWMLLSTALAFYVGFEIFNDVYLSLKLFTLNYSIIYLIYLVRSYKFSE